MDLFTSDPLLSPSQLSTLLPLSDDSASFIARNRQEIKSILKGDDSRFLIISGPCSVHDIPSTLEYAKNLKQLQQLVAPHFLLVMRLFVEKPRTCLGWKGLLHDPDLDGSFNLSKGLFLSRYLLLELAKLRVPAAMEFLELFTPYYLADLISWGCIGARTVTSQPHRQLAATLPLPIGFKNGLDGDIHSALQAMNAAMQPQVCLGINPQGQVATINGPGNQSTHLILRGGYLGPNCCKKNILHTHNLLTTQGLNKKLIVDCAHGNSQKHLFKQKTTFESVFSQILEGNPAIAGLMLESHLKAGKQTLHSPSSIQYGISLTDPCLSWQETQDLILKSFHLYQKQVAWKAHPTRHQLIAQNL